jgi:hypothetical protein
MEYYKGHLCLQWTEHKVCNPKKYLQFSCTCIANYQAQNEEPCPKCLCETCLYRQELTKKDLEEMEIVAVEGEEGLYP